MADYSLLRGLPKGSWASGTTVRQVMRANRSRDTRPELSLRRAAHRVGLRYFVNREPFPKAGCRADLVFPRARVAVFVDGCFWHACPTHGRRPVTNRGYWEAKLDRNQARDRAVDAHLEDAGWRVVHVWEHDDMVAAARALRHLLKVEVGDGRTR